MNNLTSRIIGAVKQVSVYRIVTLATVLTLLLQSVTNQERNTIYQESLIKRMDTLEMKIQETTRQIDSLNMMHPWKAKSNKRTSLNICNSTIIGKLLWGGYSSNLHVTMVKALEDYTGPKVCVNSTIRHWNTKSAHKYGKAIDLKLEDDVLEWLISDQGLV
jgi:hypothetical protein